MALVKATPSSVFSFFFITVTPLFSERLHTCSLTLFLVHIGDEWIPPVRFSRARPVIANMD